MASNITSITGAGAIKTFGDIPSNEDMYTKGQVETRLGSITKEVADIVATEVSRSYKYKGSEASIAAVEATSGYTPANGDVWNITAAFTLDGVSYPAGTDIAWIEDASASSGSGSSGTSGHWNALGGRTFDDSGVVKKIKLTSSDTTGISPSNNAVTIPAAAPTGTGATPGLMTAADKAKLDGIATNAQVNVIESVKVDGGSALSVANKAVDIPAGSDSAKGVVQLSDATDGTAAAASGKTAATPKAVADALAAAKSYAEGLSPDLSSRIKKSTVKGLVDSPPATLANLPSNSGSLTLNQILNALYAGASETES